MVWQCACMRTNRSAAKSYLAAHHLWRTGAERGWELKVYPSPSSSTLLVPPGAPACEVIVISKRPRLRGPHSHKPTMWRCRVWSQREGGLSRSSLYSTSAECGQSEKPSAYHKNPSAYIWHLFRSARMHSVSPIELTMRLGGPGARDSCLESQAMLSIPPPQPHILAVQHVHLLRVCWFLGGSTTRQRPCGSGEVLGAPASLSTREPLQMDGA